MCSFVLFLLACLPNHLSTYIAINQAHFFFFNKKWGDYNTIKSNYGSEVVCLLPQSLL